MQGPQLDNRPNVSNSPSQSSGIVSREQLNKLLEGAGMALAQIQFPAIGLAMRGAYAARGAVSQIGASVSTNAGALASETTNTAERLGTSDVVARPNKLSVV